MTTRTISIPPSPIGVGFRQKLIFRGRLERNNKNPIKSSMVRNAITSARYSSQTITTIPKTLLYFAGPEQKSERENVGERGCRTVNREREMGLG